MRAFMLAVSLALMAAPPLSAHFVFIIPDASGQKATVVFSDKLEPDSAVDIGTISGTTLKLRRGGAPDEKIDWSKNENSLTLSLPGLSDQQLYGTTEYGVMQRGGGKPFLLLYHPKAILGDVARSTPLGAVTPVEIMPVRAGNGIRFRLLAGGKPKANADVTVIAPGASESKKVKTDAEGLTPEFSGAGRYGVWGLHAEPKSGEFKGKKYDEIRRYATLVVTIPK